MYTSLVSVIRQFDRLKDTHKVEPQYLDTAWIHAKGKTVAGLREGNFHPKNIDP